ncbi:MAG: hypothetical protein J6K28_00910 [Alistipes sp.]|nr:hypothetical protein [Alistipes sp.]
MKKLILLGIAFLTMTACDDKEPNLIPVIDVIEVYDSEGRNVYHESGVEWRLMENPDGKYTLYMDKTRFIDGMPYLDMEVRNLENQYDASFNDDFFKNDTPEAIPYHNGVAMPNYTLYDFKCETDEEAVNVKFRCMKYDVRYRGSLVR